MADSNNEFRHAGIGLSLNIDGFEALQKLNQAVTDTINNFKGIVDGVNNADKSVSSFSQNAKGKFGDVDSAIKQANDSGKNLTDSVKASQQALDSLKTDNVVNVNQSFKDANTSANNLRQTVAQAQQQFSNFNTSSINGVKSALGDTHDAGYKLIGDFGGIKQKITELNPDSIVRIKGQFGETTEKANWFHTALDKLHNGLTGLNKSWFGRFITGADDAKQHVESLGEKLDGVLHKLGHMGMTKSVAVGNMLSNGASALTSDATSGIESGIENGLNYQMASYDMQRRWEQLGLNRAQTQAMIGQIGDIRQHTNMSAADILAMQRQYYGITGGNASQARALTNTVTSFGAAYGLNDRSQMAMNRLISSNKGINARMAQRTFAQAPGFENEIIKASGMTTKAFDAMVQNGKLTGAQLREYMIKASKDSSHAWADYADTTAGRIDAMKSTVANAKKAFDMNLTGSIFDVIKREAGNGSKLNDIMKQITDTAKEVGSTIGNVFGEVLMWVVKNQQPLKDIIGSLVTIVKVAASTGWNILIGALKAFTGNGKNAHSALETVSGVMHRIADFAQTLAKEVTSAFSGILKTIQANAKPLETIITSLFQIAKIIGMTVWNTFSNLFKQTAGNGSLLHGALELVAGSLKKVASWKPALQELTKIIIGVFAIRESMRFGRAIYDNAKSVIDFAKSIDIVKIATTAWNGVTKAFTAVQWAFNAAMDANPIGVIILAITGVIAILVELYKHCKPFREFVNSWFKNLWTGMKEVVAVTVEMGKGVMKVLKPLFSWIGKTFGSLFKLLGSIFKAWWDGFKDWLRIFGDLFTGNFKDLGKAIPKLFGDMFDGLKDIGKSSFDFLNNMTGGMLGDMVDIFSNMFDEIGKVWHDAWTGIGHFFEGIWDWIKSIVQNGINGVVDVLNLGINGIDGVIHMFGGSSEAIKPIAQVKLATGTGYLDEQQRRKITKPVLATLNDGYDSPETDNKEMVMHPNGATELIQGRNTKKVLEPGAEVFNAKETKALLASLGTDHFASGTGFLSGLKHMATGALHGAEHLGKEAWNGAVHIVDSIKGKLKFVQQLVKNPLGYLGSLFSKPFKATGEVMQDLGSGMVKSTINTAKSWWGELVDMMKGDLGGNSGQESGLLNAVIKYGKGHRYVLGTRGPDTFDCSGLVYYALKNAFGITLDPPSGSQIRNSEPVSAEDARPGDLVGNDGHIGVYAGHGRYWAAASPDASPNIGYSLLSYFPDGAYHFARVRGLDDKVKSQHKGNNGGSALQKLIKSQTGGMLGWIAKHLAPLLSDDGGGSSANPAGVGVERWKPDVVKALKANGFSASDDQVKAWLAVIQRESNGNPHAINNWDINAQEGHPSKGLVQTIDSTFDTYAFPGHHDIWNGYDDLLSGIKYMKAKYGSGQQAFDYVSDPSHGYRYGGNLKRNQPVLVGEAGPEIFTPSADGVVTNHEESKHMISNSNGKVEINAPLTINYSGSGKPEDIKQALNESYNSHLRMLAEKIGQAFGVNIDEA